MFPILWTESTAYGVGPVDFPTPPFVQDSLQGLIRWGVDASAGTQVFLVDESLCKRWGLQPEPLHRGNGPVLAFPDEDVRHGPPGPWITYLHGRGRLHVGFLPWIARQGKDFPILADLLTAGTIVDKMPARLILARLQRWFGLTGRWYAGTPGVAGVDLLRHQYDTRAGWAPRWQYAAPITAHERELTRWVSPHHPGAAVPRVRLDGNRMYLAAMGTAMFAPGALTETPAEQVEHLEFTPGMAGWWLITADPWPYPKQLPDPLGRTNPDLTGQRFWVTTPTLQFWDQLTRSGAVTGYSIHGAYLGRGTRLLRDWAAKVDTAWQTIHDADTAGGPLVETVKGLYRQTFGLFNHEGGRIYRPDWHYTIIGQARATLLRKAWNHGQATGEWPVAIQTDALTYSPDCSHHEITDCPGGGCQHLHTDNEHQALGQFKIKE